MQNVLLDKYAATLKKEHKPSTNSIAFSEKVS